MSLLNFNLPNFREEGFYLLFFLESKKKISIFPKETLSGHKKLLKRIKKHAIYNLIQFICKLENNGFM